PVSLAYEIEKKSLLNGLRYYFSKTGPVFVIVVILITLWNLLSLILLIAAFFNGKLDLTIRIFFFLLIGYLVFACGPGGYARFKTSIYPFILYLIPLGYEVLRISNTNFKYRVK
ncbi:MAG: hypothetical protein H7X99_03250, partial [Saprospiraceae bacterium]|nr:hypothetical protein [Saprospiraceae bacterium]